MNGDPKKILIVEDDRNLQVVYSQKFTDNGFQVFVATNGHQAISEAKDKHPNVILLDIMLPEGMNGFDVMETLRRDEKLKDIPIVVLTNLDSERDTAMDMGASDYIVKANTSIDELVDKVRSHI